jgi:hypothetical protein
MHNLTTSATQLSDTAPKIDQFLYYAERSIKLGAQCVAVDGDIGIRTPLSGSAQLVVARHARCRSLFSPSTSLEKYSEVRDVWTNALDRAQDIGIGAQHKFPSEMPALPLANASGAGPDIMLRRFEQNSLGPGRYGALRMLYESELWLAAGVYIFSSIEMDERARLLALPGGVMVRVSGRLWTDSEARIMLQRDEAEAARFVILVAGSDETANESDKSQTAPPRAAVVLGVRAHLHALLAAPHGTTCINFGARIKGAVAAFDIVAENEVHAEFQSGFPVNPAGEEGSQELSGYFNSPARPLVGPVPQNTPISLAIGLPVQNPSGLSGQIAQVSDPRNANFRQFITQAEFKATFGATDADYASVTSWATDNGFTTVATYSNNLLLSVQATAAIVEQAFFVNLVFRQRTDGSMYVSVDRDPSLNLSVPILEVSGLNDYYPVRNLTNPTGTGNGGSLRAADLRNAYIGVGNPLQALDGFGQVVGIVDSTTFAASDISGYASLQAPVQGQNSPMPAPNVTIVATEGGHPGADALAEADLDVAMVYAMAPGAQILFFQGSTGITGHLDDILHAMATSATPLTIASCSLAFGYSANSDQALGQMAVNGVTFFTASGDSGDIGNNDPGDLKFVNQTLVGGTILNTNPVTSLSPIGYPNPYYSSENTWNTDLGATGGGILNGVPIPDYQVGVSMATNGGSTTNRNYPDVAAVATNVEFVLNGLPISDDQGTSFAAPIWAGFMALVNQFGQNSGGPGKAGFINPTIYDIGLTRGTADDLYKVCFNDIADNGSNGAGGGGSGHNSVAGYDLCTGWGSPRAGLINQLGSQTPLTSHQPLVLIRFVITTGNDNAGGGAHGSSQTADCFVPGGGVFTLTLRNSSDPSWGNGSTHEVDFTIPAADSNGNPVPTLTPTEGLTGVRINLVQHNPNISADNWDIANLQVSLFNPGSPQVCQLNLIGTSRLQDGSIGLVRLSKNPGSSGNGPSSPIYPTGPGSGC